MSKNIINEVSGSGSVVSSASVAYEEFTVATRQIKFNIPGEVITGNWSVAGVPYADPADYGFIPGIRLVRVGKAVTLYCPGWLGEKNGSVSEICNLVLPGEIPSRFLPSTSVQISVDPWMLGNFLSDGQDLAICYVLANGYVAIQHTTKNMQSTAGNPYGMAYGLTISWVAA